MTIHYTLWVRKQIEVNTDPQRRCYNGCNFSSEMQWTAWEDLLTYRSYESTTGAMDAFQKINPSRQYKITQEELQGVT